MRQHERRHPVRRPCVNGAGYTCSSAWIASRTSRFVTATCKGKSPATLRVAAAAGYARATESTTRGETVGCRQTKCSAVLPKASVALAKCGRRTKAAKSRGNSLFSAAFTAVCGAARTGSFDVIRVAKRPSSAGCGRWSRTGLMAARVVIYGGPRTGRVECDC